MWIKICFSLLLIQTVSGYFRTSCRRHSGWCSHKALYTLMDCDGDGILDPVCSDVSGAFGIIGLSTGCKSEWPKKKCLNGKVCHRVNWCGHAGSTFFYHDCDGDGILDPVCSDTRGNFGIIKSSANCKSEWPHAICQGQGAPGYTCRRHHNWCSHSGSAFTLMDCDRDGIPDPVCTDTNGAFGVIKSTNGCHSTWPNASCHTKKGKVCSRPKGWCGHAGSRFMFKDCDGDGIPDPVCTDTRGNLGVVKSSKGCSSNWPHDVCKN